LPSRSPARSSAVPHGSAPAPPRPSRRPDRGSYALAPMARRSEQRRAAVFALYQHELTGRPLDDVFERGAPSFTRALAHAAADNQAELDEHIARHASGWTLDRIAPLERAIMRVALLEMLHPDLLEGDRPIPPEGAISEAVETAKEFCGAQAPGFVNGVLAAALRSVRQNGAQRA
jgi:transcription antitermination protein NusB